MCESIKCTMLASDEIRSWKLFQFYSYIIHLDKVHPPIGPSKQPLFILRQRIRDYSYNRLSKEIFYNDLMDVLKDIPVGKKVSVGTLMRMMPGPRFASVPQTRVMKSGIYQAKEITLSKKQEDISTWIAGKFTKLQAVPIMKTERNV